MKRETFSETDINFFKQMLSEGYSPSVIYDIGASNAAWSKCISDILPDAEYHLFEPLASVNFSLYEKQLRSTLAEHPEFKLHPVALGHKSGMTELSVTKDGVGSSLIAMATAEQVQVPCWRLEEYVRAKKLPQPQVLKMDVQGYEACVLEGAGELLAKADVLMLETWFHRGYGPDTPLITELVEALWPLGFVLFEVGGPYIDHNRRLTAIDAFFVSERVLEDLKRKKKAALAAA